MKQKLWVPTVEETDSMRKIAALGIRADVPREHMKLFENYDIIDYYNGQPAWLNDAGFAAYERGRNRS